ncbi:MAG TPA: hypothetical protein VMZ53_18270 [Kofleriaceae bacterium]|nr:hypothetical protein [Kofleriaceae bacterium]
MARATWVFVATSAIAAAAAIWLYLDNADLRAQLAASKPTATSNGSASDDDDGKPAKPTGDTWASSSEPSGSSGAAISAGPGPRLPEQKGESRLERRQRRMEEFSAMFGRLDGETEEEYRNRIVPLIKGGLLIPRQRVEDMRKEIEQKANVSPEQSKQLDQAFDKVYADALDYTNKAVADGLLSPYERNVSGWLEYAGGMGGILNDANGQIGKILTPDQMKTIGSSGFEWGEYLGLNAPWENLKPPPPQKPTH